jgi:aspartyl-tRNA(Asn)/glutamyl-tRNA(Gln) amidotransferase subunit B
MERSVNMKQLEPTIGIEVHVELKTKSKLFSSSLNEYGKEINTTTNVVDLGYPGTLPTLNKEVLSLALKAAIIFNCNINKTFHFDRKNYFYPDNPKNYQITQSRIPLGYDGYVEIDIDGVKKRIGIERVHIEEDTAKSSHVNNKTLLDFNRAGVPLIEIVSKPEMNNGKEAILYLEKIREMLLYANISDVKIEEGSMRCDANVSLKEKGSLTLGTKSEIKNIGSISNVEAGINYEIIRQTQLLNENNILREETRRYDEKSKTTILMRVKELGNDYRYFPEPDIPFVNIDDDYILNISNNIPILSEERRNKYRQLGVSDININKIISNKELSDYYDELLDSNANPIIASNLLTSDIVGYLNKNNISISKTKLTANKLTKLITMIDSNEISSKIAKDLLIDLLETDNVIEDIINNKQIKQINNTDELKNIINGILSNNTESINDYKNGKDRAIKYLIGQIMKETKGQANPVMVNDILIDLLNKY